MKTRYLVISIFLFFSSFNIGFAQQQWTEVTAKKWVDGLQWSNGSKLKLNPSVDYVEFAKQYHVNKQYWDKAIAFLNDKNLKALKPGKYVIDGDNVYAMITEAPSKEFDKSAWESHRNYIDLHYLIRGKEKIGRASVAAATVTKPYDASKDMANYDAEGKFYIADPGEFFLFFPGDAHRPSIKVEGYDTVKKLVIKIRYASIDK